MAYRRSTWEEQLAGTALGLGLVLAVVALVMGIWLTVKVTQILIRALINHPRHPWLLGCLISTGLLLVLVALTAGQDQRIDALAGISAGALLLVATALTIADDARLRRPLDRDTAVHAVLHEWWPAA